AFNRLLEPVRARIPGRAAIPRQVHGDGSELTRQRELLIAEYSPVAQRAMNEDQRRSLPDVVVRDALRRQLRDPPATSRTADQTRPAIPGRADARRPAERPPARPGRSGTAPRPSGRR